MRDKKRVFKRLVVVMLCGVLVTCSVDIKFELSGQGLISSKKLLH